MCILCVIQKLSRRVATVLPWLVIPLIGLWALSQLLPPAFRFEITSPRLACVFVLLVTLFWYEILMPQLSAWRVRRNARLRERKRFEALEMQKLRKTATRRCRNCYNPYRDQNPGGGRFMCSYCGHVSKRPALDLPPGLAISNSGIVKELVGKSGKILNGKGWSENGWMCSQDWLENGNWVGGPIPGNPSNWKTNENAGLFGGDEHCVTERSYSGILYFICKLLTSFFLSIRWLWRKIFRISSREECSSDAEHRALAKRGENGESLNESRGEKARRKAEEKRQARLEKELLEEEERKQREEVARLVEERRRLRDEKAEAEKDRMRSLNPSKETNSRKETEKKRQEKRRDKDKGSSKSNSDVEELERRAGKENERKRDVEKKCETDRREHQKSGLENGKGQSTDNAHSKNMTANNYNRGNTGTRYFDRVRGTFLSSSKAFGFGILTSSSSSSISPGTAAVICRMGEVGKRNRPQRDRGDRNGDNKNQKRRVNDNERDRGELVVYRILCPDGVIGSVIGKNGKVINSIRQETRAKVKVVDPFPGSKNRVITIYCHVKDKEEIDAEDEFDNDKPLCAAQDALIKVHSAISNATEAAGDSEKKRKSKEECQILVPSSQSAIMIGKAGATIKRMRVKTRTNIKVVSKDAADPEHSCAMEFDNFVVITGEPEAVKRALFAVSTIMYKFSPKEDIPLDTSLPETPHSIIIPSEVPIYPPGGLYPTSDPIIQPRSFPQIIGTTTVQDLHGYADTGNAWSLYSSSLPVVSSLGASQSEELVIRMLCPSGKIGHVIGKGGGTIKRMRQASGARIEVDDSKARHDDCLITITATESSSDLKSIAVEAVLLLQEKINDEDDTPVSIRLLVPSKVIGCIIGRSGSIINEIRKRTKADIQISRSNKPKYADDNDELVEVVGEVDCVRDALIQIILRLREDVLRKRDIDQKPPIGAESLYAGSSVLSAPSMLPSIPAAALAYDQRTGSASGTGLGMHSSSSRYGYDSYSMADNGYGSISSYATKMYDGHSLPPLSTSEMLVPANAVGKVVGKGGANLANIRKISGATVEISESKSYRGERVALISGTSEEKRAAENLIQAFIMAA